MIYENQEQLDADLAFWQKQLRLRDWTVRAKVVRQRDIPTGEQAYSFTNTLLKDARILLLDPVDYDETQPPPLDHEHDLVHELQHLPMCAMRMCAFGENEPPAGYLIAEEQTIDCTAHGLVKLRRELQAAKPSDPIYDLGDGTGGVP